MAKNKSKTKNKNKQKRNGRRATQMVSTYGRPGSTSRAARIPRNLVQAVCSQIDPFCPHAVGSKLFGSDATYTIPFAIKAYVTLTTNASGVGCIMFRPRLLQWYQEAATFTGTTVASWATPVDCPDYTNLNTQFSKFRIVNYGFRVFGQTAATASQGVVHIFTDQDAGSPDFASSFHEEIQRVAIRDCEVHALAKSQGETATLWRDTNTSEIAHNVLYVAVSGAAASTPVLGIEITMNVEFQPDLGVSMSALSTPPAPSNALVEQARANAMREIKAIQTKTQESVGGYLERVAYKALGAAASAAGGFFFGPPGAATAGLLTNAIELD